MLFRVFIHGKNAVINADGRPRRLGFFTVRIVDAADSKAAERNAITLVESDEWLRGSLLNGKGDPFVIAAEEVDEAAPNDREMLGYSWYPMEGDA